MARRKVPEPPTSTEPLRLRVGLEDAQAKITVQINKGEELLAIGPRNEAEYENLKEKTKVWTDYNRELLKTMFSTSEISAEYAAAWGRVGFFDSDLSDWIEELKGDIRKYLGRLRSIFERLGLYSAEQRPIVTPRGEGGSEERIFLVHGHNHAIKDAVARFLERFDLEVTILHEQPDQGKTLIEKFEAHAGTRFAIVLLTPDDVGCTRDEWNSIGEKSLQARARQNVILELGYFIGRLGRERVCALKAEDVEQPSDLNGVMYIPIDANDAWKLRLAREIKAAGFPIDLNQAI